MAAGIRPAPARRTGWLAARLALPLAVQVLVALVLIDLYEYTFHRLAHAWRPLWLLHAVHHSDPHVDVTTAMRHHPLETAIAFGGRMVIYVGLGLPLWIEVVRVIVVNTALLAQHANVGFPTRDRGDARRAGHARAASPAPQSRAAADRPQFRPGVLDMDRLFGTYVPPRGDAPPEYGLQSWPASATRRWPACC